MLREIPGYPGYLASEDGTIWSTRRGAPIPLARRLHRGYYRVNVNPWHRRIHSTVDVHRLMLLAFRGPPPSPSHQCRHLDGDELNNAIANICWGTPSENMADQRRHGTMAALRHGEASNAAKLAAADVITIRRRALAGERQGAIATDYGVTQRHISDIKHGETWKHLWGGVGGRNLCAPSVRDRAQASRRETRNRGKEIMP